MNNSNKVDQRAETTKPPFNERETQTGGNPRPTFLKRFKEWMKHPQAAEWVMVYLTTAIVIFGVFGTIFTCQQTQTAKVNSDAALVAAYAADSSVRVAKAQLLHQVHEDSIGAIRDSSNDAAQRRMNQRALQSQQKRDSLSLASFMLEERAYLVVEVLGYDEERIRWCIKNVGRTPAYKVDDREFVHTAQTTDNRIFGLTGLHSSIYTRRNVDSGYVIGSGGSCTERFRETHFSGTDSKSKLYFFGNIVYQDVFRRSHYTNFTFVYDGQTMAMTKDRNDAN